MMRFLEQHRRIGIFVIAFGWAVLSVSYYNLDPHAVSFLPLITGLYAVAAVFTFLFGLRPSNDVLFKLSGACGCLGVAAMTMGVIFGQKGNPDLPFIVAIRIVTGTGLFAGIWWFWQKQVREWHVYHQERKHPTPEPC